MTKDRKGALRGSKSATLRARTAAYLSTKYDRTDSCIAPYLIYINFSLRSFFFYYCYFLFVYVVVIDLVVTLTMQFSLSPSMIFLAFTLLSILGQCAQLISDCPLCTPPLHQQH